MLYIVLFFLTVSVLFYVLFAGADFGAGIVELFSSEENQSHTKKTLYRVMGPIWEANHIWIIIVLVILWVAFPEYYNIFVVYLHIPLSIMLLGITLRGVAFVFRHYDAIIDDSQKVYDFLFKSSSLITPILLGIIFGTLVSGQIELNVEEADFGTLYIKPWLHPFSIFVGLFFASLCAFLSATLLIGEATTALKKVYARKSKIATLVVVFMGFWVLLTGFVFRIPFVKNFLYNAWSWVFVGISATLLIPMWKSIQQERIIMSRALAGLQVVCILAAAAVPNFPNYIATTNGNVSLLANVASDSVINSLGMNLIIGGLIILPGLFHLLKSFKMIKVLEQE